MERHRLCADPERQHARLRRRGPLPRWRPPRRGAEAELEQLAVPGGPGAGLLRPARVRHVGGHHGLEGAHRHGRALRLEPRGGGDGGRADRQPLRVLHGRLDPARAGAAGQRLERRPLRSRRVAALLQQGPGELPGHADLDVPPGLRPQPARRGDLRRRPRGVDRRRERLARPLRQGRRAGAGRRRRHPDVEVSRQQRRYPLPRAVVGAAGAGRAPCPGHLGADRHGTRDTAVEPVHLRRHLHHDVQRGQRLGRDLPRPGADDRVHARGLADDHRQARHQGRQRHGRRGATTSTAPHGG